jgi:hypothetical protein
MFSDVQESWSESILWRNQEKSSQDSLWAGLIILSSSKIQWKIASYIVVFQNPGTIQAHDFCYILQKSQLEIATAVLNPRNKNRYLAQFINMHGDHMELTCHEDVQAGEKTHRACKFCREPSPPGNGPTNAL